MVRTRTLALALVAVIAFAAPAAAQDSPAVASGKRFVADNQKTIARVMHPTARLQSVDPVEVTESSGGFVMAVNYRFKGAVNELFSSKLAFTFDDGGRLAGLEARESTSFVRPFSAANAGLKVLRDVAKEVDRKKDSPIREALNGLTAQAALEQFLKAKQPAATR